MDDSRITRDRGRRRKTIGTIKNVLEINELDRDVKY